MSQPIASKLLELLGGAGNIAELENCMTRVRVQVKQEDLVNVEEIKKLSEVLTVMKDDTGFQIVVGPGAASRICDQMKELGIEVMEQQAEDHAVIHKHDAKGLFAFISKVFLPLIPVFAGAGLLFGLKQIFVGAYDVAGIEFFNPANVADGGSVFMGALNVLAGTFFTYLNIAVAMSACKNLGGNPYLGLVGGGIVISVGALEGAATGIPGVVFQSGRGGVMAAFAAGALMAIVEKWVKKRTPDSLAIHVPSLVSIIVVGLLTLFVLQPVFGFVLDLITGSLMRLFENAGPLGGAALSFSWLFLVMLGIHHGFTPINTALIQSVGYTPLYPFGSLAGGGQVGASLALMVKYRSNKNLVSAVKGGLPAGILGIGEPLIYGVSLPLGRIFPLACLGGAVGGAVMGFFTQGSVAVNVSGILGVLVNISPLVYFAGYAISVVAGFVLVYFVGAKQSALDTFEGHDLDSH